MILLAIIGAAHGIKGDVKVKTFTADPTNIMAYGPLRDEKGIIYSLKLIKVTAPDTVIVTIKGIADRNQAEALRGIKLYVDREQLPDLPEEEFYHSDLLGMVVEDLEGNEIGHVSAVNNFGAGDFIELIDSHQHLFTIPFTKEAIPHIQVPTAGIEGKMVIDRRFLLDSTASREDDSLKDED